MDRAADVERSRLSETFVRLCEVESPSGRERAVQELIRSELESLECELSEDNSASETGADCGNLLAHMPAADGRPTIMLCSHIDTVPLEDRVEVELSNGVFSNRRRAILGADNKAAVAVLLELARIYARAPREVGLELLFTTSEEVGLRGAKAFDVAGLEAEFGYVFDHPSPIGELIVAAPTHFRIEANFRGRSAHAGVEPEEGRSAIVAAARAVDAMDWGRIDRETTANVGRVAGGTATNVVADACYVEMEVRSLDDAIAQDVTQRVVDACSWAAGQSEVDVDTAIEQDFRAYRVRESDPVVKVALAALSDCDVAPTLRSTGGGSDANAFQAKGFACLNMANATEANHSPDERVSLAALETMLEVALRLVARAGEV